MQNMEGFYNEVAAALQFPLYFGKNWAALDECLADLDWLSSGGYVLVFSDASLILRSSAEGDADAFFKLLSRISDEWAEGATGSDGGPRPFHVMLQVEVADADQFLLRLESVAGGRISKAVLIPVAN
jgi:RNAse (barnase) inhibitor barstar